MSGLKKNLDLSVSEKRKIVEPEHPKISIKRQCELVGLRRSTYYYVKRKEPDENKVLMKLLYEQYTKTPFYGVRKMTHYLKTLGYKVNVKRVRRLLKLLGLETVYRKPRFKHQKKSQEDKVFPYLLSDVEITKPNQVWSTDITYIRVNNSWAYLICIIDCFSRMALSWQISNTMDSILAVNALNNAFETGVPEILNSDQGVQFTSHDFVNILQARQVSISMVGKGRCWDNILIERVWRSLKYEEVYLNEYSSLKEARESIDEYFKFYNNERFHENLGYKTPREIYIQNSEKNEKELSEKVLTKTT